MKLVNSLKFKFIIETNLWYGQRPYEEKINEEFICQPQHW